MIVDDPAATLGEMRAMASDLLWVRELAAAEAAALLVPAFAATDAGRELPLGEDFRDARALVLARHRAATGAAGGPAAPGPEDPGRSP